MAGGRWGLQLALVPLLLELGLVLLLSLGPPMQLLVLLVLWLLL